MNIKKIAQIAGVSVSTVSLALNNKPGVSEEKRTRVLGVAEKINYIPNNAARSLVTKKTKSVGVIVPDISEVFYGVLARAVQDGLGEQQYSMILCNSDNKPEKESDTFSFLIEKGVDGIIMVPGTSANVEELRKRRLPVVFVDRYAEGIEASYVGIDNERAGYETTMHFLRLGHRRIGCVSGPMGATSSEERIHGYKRALSDKGVAFDRLIVKESDLTVEGGYGAAREMIALKDTPTALFVMGDTCAIGVYKALDEMRMVIPDDIAIIGFDDMPFSPYLTVPLTTVRQPIRELGRASVELLFETIRSKNRNQKRKVILSSELIVRDSCGFKCKLYAK
jgi:LacI family transcriptional regulator